MIAEAPAAAPRSQPGKMHQHPHTVCIQRPSLSRPLLTRRVAHPFSCALRRQFVCPEDQDRATDAQSGCGWLEMALRISVGTLGLDRSVGALVSAHPGRPAELPPRTGHVGQELRRRGRDGPESGTRELLLDQDLRLSRDARRRLSWPSSRAPLAIGGRRARRRDRRYGKPNDLMGHSHR